MAVKGYPDRQQVDELIDSLVVRKIMGHEQEVNQVHIKNTSRAVDLLSVVRHELDDPVRIMEGQGDWWTIQVNNHPGDRGINISRNPIPVPIDHPGCRI
jgi:DNA-binding protein